MSFEITFLGSSGGPIEGSNCCILVKPAGVSYGDIIHSKDISQILCVDAGAGLAKLSDIIFHSVHNVKNSSLTSSGSSLLDLYGNSKPLETYYSKNIQISNPFSSLDASKSPYELATTIFKHIKNYLISHPHLDHIYSLVLNSPNFTQENNKQVFGNAETISALNSHIFNGIIWPNMQEFDIIKFNIVDFNDGTAINENYVIKMFKLSHGKLTKDKRHNSITINENFKGSYQESNSITYVSSAFLINYLPTNQNILIFGDFESDLISNLNLNAMIWVEISSLIVNGQLNTIVLECSNTACFEHKLYGHLNPEYLIKELCNLRDCCTNRGGKEYPLEGVHIIINHVKESDGTFDPRSIILQHLNQLNEEYDLRVDFSVALSGVSIIV